MEIEDHYLIQKINIYNDEYWSNAFHIRVPADVSIEFQYVSNTPFIKRIESSFQKENLEYKNTFLSLIQKLDSFTLTPDQYWRLNEYSHNPYITFDADKYDELSSLFFKKHLHKIKNEFQLEGIDLDAKFDEYNNRWFLPESGNEQTRILIDSLRHEIFF